VGLDRLGRKCNSDTGGSKNKVKQGTGEVEKRERGLCGSGREGKKSGSSKTTRRLKNPKPPPINGGGVDFEKKGKEGGKRFVVGAVQKGGEEGPRRIAMTIGSPNLGSRGNKWFR